MIDIDLTEFTSKHGPLAGLLMYGIYKEVPIAWKWVKQRLKNGGGKVTSLDESIKKLVEKVDVHITNATRDTVSFETFKAAQEQINIRLDEKLENVQTSVEDIKNLLMKK